MAIKDKVRLNKITHSVRASQAVLQYGVGAMVDFPEQTLMTAAPETWSESVVEIHDERLEKVLKVDFFGMPGSKDDSKYQNGVSYVRFPEWYFCPKCRKFQPLKDWLKDYQTDSAKKKLLENDPYMIKRVKCPFCFQDLVVARIVVACGQGHIDDFPWIKWVHAKNKPVAKKICGNPKLRFTTSASSTEGLEGLTISCVSCNARATLQGAFDKGALEKLDKKTGFQYGFQCTGRHPWKNVKEPCGEYPHVLQRGGSSVYFPISVSSLVIPPYSSMLTSMVQNSSAFSYLKKAITESIKAVVSLGIPVTQEMKEQLIAQKISEYADKVSLEIGKPVEKVRPILERRWNGTDDDEYTTTSVKYRAEEYVALNGEMSLDDNKGEFVRESVDVEDYGLPYVKGISLIHKVREVQALIGYSRLEPVDSDNSEIPGRIKKINIKEESTNWYPGYDVRGEGIFIEFDEDAINAWRNGNEAIQHRVDLLNENYSKSYYGEKRPREITAKFLLLHTLSHLLMKQLSFECGYSIASIKERLYCSEESEGRAMAGIFIYTASGDSEGTMGGLVRQGRADTFPAIFKKALEVAITCSNDPVCSLSNGQGRDSLNLSACHSCTLVPETSCEEFNVFLDRGVVLGTFEERNIGFYSEQILGDKKWMADKIHSLGSTKMKSDKDDKKIVITDMGTDMQNSSFASIWASMLQFSEDNEERTFYEQLIDHEHEYLTKEHPCQGATFQVEGCSEYYTVDLLWKKSRVMFFSCENEEEYQLAKKSDWKCFCLIEEKFDWKDLINTLMEK